MTPVQRKVAKTVKKMRHLGLTPYDGLLKPKRKIPVGSFIEDLEEVHKKTAFGTKVSILFSFIEWLNKIKSILKIIKLLH